VVGPQTVDRWVLVVDAPVMMAATLALVPVLRRDGCITRAEGAVLLAGYAAYLAALLGRGGN
jgi:Ca2+/Na+ antiporter